MRLEVNGTTIERAPEVKILGVIIQQDGRATKWYDNIRRTWKSTIGTISKVTSKSWGAQEHTLRRLVSALLVSKTMYGWNYLRLSRAQKDGLERLNNNARRLITGLPKCTKLEDLNEIADINRLNEIAAEDKLSQVLRLQKTPAGRKILNKLGYQYATHLYETSSPPWEDTFITETKPIPQNMGKEQDNRRCTMARHHLKQAQAEVESGKIVYYSDAAVSKDAVALATVNSKGDGPLEAKRVHCFSRSRTQGYSYGSGRLGPSTRMPRLHGL